MSSKKRVPSWKSSLTKDNKEVERTPSKLYRKIVADEVADSANSTFADQKGEVSPVRLISIKHKGYINPYILDYLPAGNCVDPGPDCGVTYEFPSAQEYTFSGQLEKSRNAPQRGLYTQEAGLVREPNTAEIMADHSAFSGKDTSSVGGIEGGQNTATLDVSTNCFFEDNFGSMEGFSSENSSVMNQHGTVERELSISHSASEGETHTTTQTHSHIQTHTHLTLNHSFSSEDTIQDRAEQIVQEAVTEAREQYQNSSYQSPDIQSDHTDQSDDTNQSEEVDEEEAGLRLEQIDQNQSVESEGQSFTVDDIVEELERSRQQQATQGVPDIPERQTNRKSLEKKKSREEVVVIKDQVKEEIISRNKKSSKERQTSVPEADRETADLETNQDSFREDGGQPSADPVILSEEKKSEASERETTRTGTHGHLDTKIVENVSEQKDHLSRTELMEGGIRVVKEESVEAVKVVRETSVSEKQIRTTSDGEFKPIFSDEPFQLLLQTRLSMGEPVFKHEEEEEEEVESYNEAAIDVNGIENFSSNKPDVVPQSEVVVEKPVQVAVVKASPKEHEPQDQTIDYEVKASESDGLPDSDEEILENHEEQDAGNDEGKEGKEEKSLREKSKSPKGGGLFSFFKKKSDSRSNDDPEVSVPEDHKKTEKERKKEEKERKEREKKEEKQRKQREKEEKERKKKEEKEKKKGKNKGHKDDQKTPTDDHGTLSSPEATDLNKSFQSGPTSSESDTPTIQEEVISPSSADKPQQDLAFHLLQMPDTEAAAPIVESETKDFEGDDDQIGDVVDDDRNIIYPIETDVVVQGDKRAHTLSVSSDHREEIIQVDEPKSLTLPRTLSQGSEGGPVSPSFIKVTHQRSTSQMVAPLHSPNSSFDSAIDTSHSDVNNRTQPGHFVVVAIDFGTTFSGYAFSFTRDAESIHMMRKWEGGDPGVINQKTPTTLLLYPDGSLHSFGYTARDRYHDLDQQEANKWLYFEKFKMVLHNEADLNKDTSIRAANGQSMPALTIFSHALKFFKDHALQELSDQSAIKILNEDVKWVITVPAIWKAPAKQFMRTAAYNAGIASREYPDQLLIALEPEAASIYVRRLRMHQLVPEKPERRPLSPRGEEGHQPMNMDHVQDEFRDVEFIEIEPVTPRSPKTPVSPTIYPLSTQDTVGSEVNIPGTRYMIVDCGGGTVDITVHEMDARTGKLKELHKATGGPYGSVGVDLEFEQLLVDIFGVDFVEAFKVKRPVGWVDLMIAFESRKRAANPFKPNPLNVALPFSFIDYYKKYRGSQVDSAIKKYKDPNIRWSTQGMLRLNPPAMRRLFTPTLEKIKEAIGDVLNKPHLKEVKYLFLVGGFAESPILQQDIRQEFGHLAKLIIPQDVSLTILKGAVLFGLDPTIVNVRRSRMTYGVGVLNRFIHSRHPSDKRVEKDGIEWCTDVFDRFVVNDQPVALGDTVLRSYTPAKPGQKSSVINIYCSDNNDVAYITDTGVRKCGTLCLDLTDVQYQQNMPKRREIQTRMIFGDTEIKLSALDVSTGKCVRANIDFLT